jgi:predicted metal-dependent peptidase
MLKGTNKKASLDAHPLLSGSPSSPMRIRGDAPGTNRSVCCGWRPKKSPHRPEDLQQQRVADLRLRLLSLYPFWGYLLAEMQILWAPQLPTFAATDGVARIWLNPQWIAGLSRRQLGFVLLHELGHVVLQTLDREQHRQRHLWNRAADYAINRIVAQMPSRPPAKSGPAWEVPVVELPGVGRCEILLDPRFDHLPAEGIYARLLQDPALAGEAGPPVDLPDPQHPGTQSLPRHGGGLDVHVPAAGTPAERQAQRDRAVQRLTQAAELAQQQEEPLPFGVDRWLELQRQPALAWQTLLQRYLADQGAAVERSWARPHRRWLAEGWLVPGPVPERDGVVVLAIDTSGSMQPPQLEAIAAELTALDDAVSELWVVCADAEVQAVVRPGELPAFVAGRRFKGGGGTDHRPVFAWLARQTWRPDLLICCTDLHTTLPEQPPMYPVLWLVTPDEDGGHGRRPGFGEVVVVGG